MGFQPIIPQSGYAGWAFLNRTAETQKTAFERSPVLQHDLEYFKENIHNATTAESLVNDRRLLKVALGAFGLEGDLDKRAYILKALVEGTDDENAFANRMVDKRYQEFSKAFGYGNAFGARVTNSNFVENILTPYKMQEFEIAVGESSQSVRLAMVFSREIGELANSEGAANSSWFKVMGNSPMREVFETAFGLPKSFGTLDVDKQRNILRDKNAKMFGGRSLGVFAEPANVEKMLRTFFARSQLSESLNAGVKGTTALALITSANLGMAQFFQSRV